MKPGVDHIGIGCGCLILNDKNEVLLLKRSKKSKTDRDVWSRPGGTVEYGENIEDALKREIKEELNVDIEVVRFLEYWNDIKHEDNRMKHWIALGFLVKIVGGELRNMEPDKHTEMKWFPLDKVPTNLTPYTKNAINVLLTSRP